MNPSRKIVRLLTATASVMFVGLVVQPVFAQTEPELTDISGFTMERPAITNLIAQGVMTPLAPGKFGPGVTIKRGDFAVALQRLFNLPPPGEPVKFSDVHPTDAIYSAVEAIAPYVDKQVPCPDCEIGSSFGPTKSVSRAQWAITVVRVLVAQNKLQLVSEEQANKILAHVPDADVFSKRARVYIATALDSNVLDCCAGNTIEASQMVSRADAAEGLNNLEKRFGLSPAKPGV
jgi:hypothetical protein